jgi:hypothetical protein
MQIRPHTRTVDAGQPQHGEQQKLTREICIGFDARLNILSVRTFVLRARRLESNRERFASSF